jgi:signal transduction histidine kinase
VLFDQEGVSRAVLNVVTNALDAVEGREDGLVEIDVHIEPPPGLARITVADNGEGMSPETLADIFNIFMSTKGARGTGLGLAVSRKILREHGGDIRATSNRGTGSSFVLEFPARSAPETPPAGGDATMLGGHGAAGPGS